MFTHARYSCTYQDWRPIAYTSCVNENETGYFRSIHLNIITGDKISDNFSQNLSITSEQDHA